MTPFSTSPLRPRPSKSLEPADIVYPSAIPFLLVHLGCLAAIWSGVGLRALALCGVLYGLRMFGVCASYHRYLSHRSFATSRIFQFVLAVLAQSSAQSSVLWWAAKHRHHHRFSDTEEDLHSPLRRGFFYSHVGWLFGRRNRDTDLVQVEDLAQFPELRWLQRFELAPAALLAALSFAIAGWQGLVVGFLWSTVLVYDATFSINSLSHTWRGTRYVTADRSRNNALLALLTLGEGRHNNHHAYQSSARQGFRWWEIDPTYYGLLVLAKLGLVWNLKCPPPAVVAGVHRVPERVAQRAAQQLAAAFNPDAIAAALLSAASDVRLAELQARLGDAGQKVADELKATGDAALPSRDAVVARARACLPRTPSLEEIVDRAHELVLAAVCARLVPRLEGGEVRPPSRRRNAFPHSSGIRHRRAKGTRDAKAADPIPAPCAVSPSRRPGMTALAPGRADGSRRRPSSAPRRLGRLVLVGAAIALYIPARALAQPTGAEAPTSPAVPQGVWLMDGRVAVQIFKCEGLMCGRIVWLSVPRDPEGLLDRDKNNPVPALQQRKLCGLTILWGLHPAGANRWADGWFYNPDDGKAYRVSAQLRSDDVIAARIYVGIPLFGKTKTLTRVPHDTTEGWC